MDCEGGHCFLAAACSRAEDQDNQQNDALNWLLFITVTGGSILREAGTEQVRLILRASTAVLTLAASNARVAQWFLVLLRKSVTYPLISNGSTFLQNVLSKKKAAARSSLPQSVTTTTEALHPFRCIGYVKSWIQERHLHENLQWKTGSRIGVAAQLV